MRRKGSLFLEPSLGKWILLSQTPQRKAGGAGKKATNSGTFWLLGPCLCLEWANLARGGFCPLGTKAVSAALFKLDLWASEKVP